MALYLTSPPTLLKELKFEEAHNSQWTAPSKGSRCAADEGCGTREGSHSIKGSASPPIRLMAGQPTSLSRSMMRVAALCCLLDYSNGERIFRQCIIKDE